MEFYISVIDQFGVFGSAIELAAAACRAIENSGPIDQGRPNQSSGVPERDTAGRRHGHRIAGGKRLGQAFVEQRVDVVAGDLVVDDPTAAARARGSGTIAWSGCRARGLAHATYCAPPIPNLQTPARASM
jgi:hypothetical protein